MPLNFKFYLTTVVQDAHALESIPFHNRTNLGKEFAFCRLGRTPTCHRPYIRSTERASRACRAKRGLTGAFGAHPGGSASRCLVGAFGGRCGGSASRCLTGKNSNPLHRNLHFHGQLRLREGPRKNNEPSAQTPFFLRTSSRMKLIGTQ